MNVRAWVFATMADMLARRPGTLATAGNVKQSSSKMSEEVPRM